MATNSLLIKVFLTYVIKKIFEVFLLGCIRDYHAIYCFMFMFTGVYAFGFLFMLPQLFVNYKVKQFIFTLFQVLFCCAP